MGLTVKDLQRLGPAARAQIENALRKRSTERHDAAKTQQGPQFGSELEKQYYEAYILPGLCEGTIEKVELHKTYELLPAAEYCSIKLHKAEYTPDFVVTYASGTVEIVEVKSKAVRKLQGSYVYRRRLFIEKYARPNGWRFVEFIR